MVSLSPATVKPCSSSFLYQSDCSPCILPSLLCPQHTSALQNLVLICIQFIFSAQSINSWALAPTKTPTAPVSFSASLWTQHICINLSPSGASRIAKHTSQKANFGHSFSWNSPGRQYFGVLSPTHTEFIAIELICTMFSLSLVVPQVSVTYRTTPCSPSTCRFLHV